MKSTISLPEKYTPGLFELPLDDSTKTALRTVKNVGKSKPCRFDLDRSEVLREFEVVLQYKIRLKEDEIRIYAIKWLHIFSSRVILQPRSCQ